MMSRTLVSGKTLELTATASTRGKLATDMKASGSTGSSMGVELIFIAMEIHTQANSKTVKQLAKGKLIIITGHRIMAMSEMASDTVKANGKVAREPPISINTKVTMRMTKEKELETSPGPVAITIKEISKPMKDMGTVRCIGAIIVVTRVIGKREYSMDAVA